MLEIVFLLGVNNVSFPKVHGPPLMFEGPAGHALSPHTKNIPFGNCRGIELDAGGTIKVLLHQKV